MRKKTLSRFLVSLLILAGAALAQDSSSMYKIYNNWGKYPDCSDPVNGWLVGNGQSIAMPLTPKAASKLTEIDVAMGHCEYNCGPDGGTISLNADSNGLPGNPIHTWKFKKLGTSNLHHCPSDTKAKSRNGIALKQGSQYWLCPNPCLGQRYFWAAEGGVFAQAGQDLPSAYEKL